MPITQQEDWNKWVENNSKDPYSKACIDVAREVMRLLDLPEHEKFNPNNIITLADDNIDAGGITGFMAGCVAQMVSHCHSRGPEFKAAWNESYGAPDAKGVVNPAIVTLKEKE